VALGLAIGVLGAGGQMLLFHAVKIGPTYLIFPLISLSPALTIGLSFALLRERTGKLGLLGIVLALLVYFVGADDGFVTVYRGLPYDLPAGLSLYSVNYESGVPVSELPAGRRRIVTEHKLRSRDDAQDLVRQMETGALRGT